ncbi:hypothetical protein HDU76_003098, partial [Blyttiomyces sp. JEL0837]
MPNPKDSESFLISIPNPDMTTANLHNRSTTSSDGGTANTIQVNDVGATSLPAPKSRLRDMDQLSVQSFQLDALRNIAIMPEQNVNDDPISLGDRGLVSEPGESLSPIADSDRANPKAGVKGSGNSIETLPPASVSELFPKEVIKAVQPSDNNKHDPSTTCAVCDRPLPRPIATQTLDVKTLKPRFQREIKKAYPLRGFQPTSRICVKDLHFIMQKRIDELLEEDQTELAKLQEAAMKNLG